MSNFNLISPEGNGFNFNVRFDEPIIVPENASVHMNWCQFERDNLINFTEEQFIKIKNQQVLPFFNWNNNGNGKVSGSYLLNGIERNEGDYTFVIPQGKYSLAELQTQIVKAFTSADKTIAVNVSEERQGINANTIAPDNPSLKLYEYDLVCPVFEPDPAYLETGFMYKTKPRNFFADTVNNKGMTYDPTAFPLNGGLTRKEHTTPNGTFTNGLPDIDAYNVYSMGKHKYIHTGGHFQQYINNDNLKGNVVKNGGFDELQNLNTINFRSNTKFSDTHGSTFVGLYISGYAGATDGSVIGDLTADPLANRIHGGNMIAKRDTTLNSGGYYPKCHFGVEYTGFDTSVFTNNQHDKLNIIHAQMGVNATMESTIEGMKRVYQIDLSKYRNIGSDDSELAFGIQTYYDKGNSNSAYSGASKGDLHIRVYLQMIDGTSVVVYDTNTKYPHIDITNGDHQQYFTKAFMDTYIASTEASLQPNTINLAQAQSSIPFVPIVSATQQLEGGFLTYSQIDEFSRTESNSLLLDYQLEFSNEIGNLIQPLGNNSTYTTGVLSPAYIDKNGADNFINNEITKLFTATLGQNEFYFRENNVLGQYRQDKFSVVLNNLPIKSYKNTNDKTKSGYRKPILANIPNPFAGADMSMGNGGKILGSYQSSLGIVNRLSNQAITTNNFDVLILDLETDKPAEQLTKSIVNFTITAD